MKTRWKVLIGLGVVVLALLALNTIVLNQQTKAADVTVDGGQIVNLPGGDVQALDVPAPTDATGAPIVLIHCYLCSLEWWDELAPLLSENHRVIRIDLLGHGGSEKPSSGYSIQEQAGLVAGALSELDVQGAVVVGQSLGSAVAVALAEQSSQLVDRVVAMNQAPTNDSGGLPFLARLGYTPVLGQAIYRLTPDFAIRSNFGEAFAPDFEPSEEFEDDVIVAGLQGDDLHVLQGGPRRAGRLPRRGVAGLTDDVSGGAPARRPRRGGPGRRYARGGGGLERRAGRPARGPRRGRPHAAGRGAGGDGSADRGLRGGRGSGGG